MKRKRYTDEKKSELVFRLLNGESLKSISLEAGVHVVLLSRWRKEYCENGQFGNRKKHKSNVILTIHEAQAEIKHLTKQLDNKNLEIMVLRDLLKKNETKE